jgi:hypothetical protein
VHGLHRYYITVFALGVESLKLPGNSRYDFDAAIKGHTLAKARIMGRYERAKTGGTRANIRCPQTLAFALHALLPRRFRFTRLGEGSVGNLDLAAALIVRDHEARARDPRSGQLVTVRR